MAMKKAHITLLVPLVAAITCTSCAVMQPDIAVSEHAGVVAIENSVIEVEFDLSSGTYRATDRRDGSVCLSDATFRLDDLASNEPGIEYSWTTEAISDRLGIGSTLAVTGTRPGHPDLVLTISLYDHQGFIVLGAGLDNTTDSTVQLKRIEPVAGGTAFEGFDLSENFSMLDGFGGAQNTAVAHGPHLYSRNNLLVTFGVPGRNRSLVLGGLTYRDFEKFAEAGKGLSRRDVIESRYGEKEPLLCYLDLPGDKAGDTVGPQIRLVQGKPWTWAGAGADNPPAFHNIAFHEKAVVFEVTGIDPGKTYQAGFSWWDFDGNGRVESVAVDTGSGTERQVVFDKVALPAWTRKKEVPAEGTFTLPKEACRMGRARIIFSNEADTHNAVVSELWLRELQAPGESAIVPTADSRERPPASLPVRLFAEDPVGKRIDPGTRYLPDDRFYVDFTTRNPFEALEQYGKSVRMAQEIDLEVYDFPTVCLWYAEVYGNGQASNDTPGAVAEMDKIAASGFLEYSRAAVRLVPDLYEAVNQQGWWDDEHWRRGRAEPNRGNGQYTEPYETSAKWAQAVEQRGGIPLTYFQTGFRSQDYAEAFPGHMLFNESMAPRHDSRGNPRAFKRSMNAWQRNSVLHGYDYTDPDFVKHVEQVYANLQEAGVKGLMFDYAYSGWASEGGMEDEYSTTAAAYRTIHRLPYEGLGPDCWVHERALQRGSDISLGYIASQRVWGDTDLIGPAMVTRCGLRWYKNRTVVSYDMDAKSLLKTDPETRDGVRQMLTMCYVVSGRLLLGNSFGNLTAGHLHDLTRIFPYHTTPRSARPVDAFTRKHPRIYDYEVFPGWHQLTFYNPEKQKAVIGVDLAGDTAFGALGLDAAKSYYVYDFWNDRLVGKLQGSERLEQELRPGEARMMSIHEEVGYPQFIATDRHVMQGLVDMRWEKWESGKKKLSGRSRIVSGDPYKMVIALNGYTPTSCEAVGARSTIRVVPGEIPIAELVIERAESGIVDWAVTFEEGG